MGEARRVSETTTREKWLEGVNLEETPSGAGEVLDRPLPPSPRERWVLLSLLAIMFLGAVLRFYGLGFQSLSEGELAGWDLSNRGTFSQVIDRGEVRISPPVRTPPRRFACRTRAGW